MLSELIRVLTWISALFLPTAEYDHFTANRHLFSIPMLPGMILCLAFWETVSSVAVTTKQHRQVSFSPCLLLALVTLHFLALYDFDVISRNSLPCEMYFFSSFRHTYGNLSRSHVVGYPLDPGQMTILNFIPLTLLCYF